MRQLFLILPFMALFPSINSFQDQIDENEMLKIKAAVPADVLKAIEQLTPEDREKLYELARKDDFFSAVLIENPRLTALSTAIIKSFGDKISQLGQKPKQFVLDTINSLRKLHARAVQGKDLRLDELAGNEEKRFRTLDDSDREAIVRTFPILTDMGIFTNKKLQYLVQMLSDEAKSRQRGEL